MSIHTVEKIGGTSMSRFEDVMNNIIISDRKEKDFYNRILVVSAYSGITNMLLEHKKSGEYGVYSYFAERNPYWEESLKSLQKEMYKINKSFEAIGLNLKEANKFISERIDVIHSCLSDLMRLCSFGHFNISDYLPACREMLSSIGESHSAYNSTKILKKHGINAVCVDLSGWLETETYEMDEKIIRSFENINISKEFPVVTGYTKCKGGIMTKFDRGYSEVTFSRIAVLTNAREGIIHKECHLSSGDPELIGKDKVRIIGETNFDIADQLADLGMEAIHPRASKKMEEKNIPIRVKNTFDPKHPGTLISRDYISPTKKVEMVAGKKDIIAIEVHDPDMVAEPGYDYRILASLKKHSISYIAKNTNANTITHYVDAKAKFLSSCVKEIKTQLQQATVKCTDVSLIAATGSNMKVPGLLSKASKALADAHINILAFDQCMRQVNMQFIVDRNDFETALKVLHEAVVENC